MEAVSSSLTEPIAPAVAAAPPRRLWRHRRRALAWLTADALATAACAVLLLRA